MKKIVVLCLLLFVVSAVLGYSGHKSVQVKKIPQTLQDFLTLRNKIAKTPEGGAAVFVVAMIIYTKKPKLGMQCFTIALDRSRLRKGKVYKGFAPNRSMLWHIRRLKGKAYVPFAYVQGTSVDNGYQLPQSPYTLLFSKHRYRRNGVLVATTSGNMPRPISLKKNNRGYWKVVGASSLFVGLRKVPQKKIDDDL